MEESMGKGPRVLAAFAQLHLQMIEKQNAELAKRVRELMDPDVLKTIENSGRISWVPLAHHIALTECLFREGNRVQASEICRLTVLESFSQPFLKPLVHGALTVLGPSLVQFARWTPRAWFSLFRGVGELSWLPNHAGSGCLQLDDAHPLIMKSPEYIEGLASAFSAFFEVTKSRGSIRARAADSQVVFEFTLNK